jgi:cellobiose-specific phosphotransferase system component IIB
MSSSLLLSEIRKASVEAGVEIEVNAYHSFGLFPWDYEKNPINIVLVAPQVRMLRRSVTRAAEPFGAIVECMDPMAYGMADGQKIVHQILEALKLDNAETPPANAN